MTDPATAAPCVSVIVTVFKRTRFIANAIRSVLAQGFSDYEIIVSDDSNDEEIGRIVGGFNSQKILYNPSVVTKGVARNVFDSILLARGEYVAILNDDDSWEPNFLEELLVPLKSDPSYVISFSDHWIMDHDGVVDVPETDKNSRDWGRLDLKPGMLRSSAAVVLKKSVPMVMGALFRRDQIDINLLNDKVGGAYDYWLACILAATGRPLHYTPLRLTRYRSHPQMETHRRDPAKGEDELFILRSIIEAGWFKDIEADVQSRFADKASSAALNKLRFGRRREARALALASLRKAFLLKGAVVYLMTLAPASLWSRPVEGR